jgi:hypothetical protein
MKKYNKPQIVVVKVETQRMIAESVGLNSTAVSASSAESRDGGSWDDED